MHCASAAEHSLIPAIHSTTRMGLVLCGRPSLSTWSPSAQSKASILHGPYALMGADGEEAELKEHSLGFVFSAR